MLRRDSTQRSFFDQGLYDRLAGRREQDDDGGWGGIIEAAEKVLFPASHERVSV